MPSPTTARAAALLKELGWSNRQFSARFHCSPKTVQNWRTGIQTPPPEIMRWLGNIQAYFKAFPPPDFKALRDFE